MARIIQFPPEGKKKDSQPQKKGKRVILSPSIELDEEFDRKLKKTQKWHRPQEADIPPSTSPSCLNVTRFLGKKPEELLVFCNTVLEEIDHSVTWGDIFGLTDPPDTFRYLFTLYTKSYAEYCRQSRGEEISASAEDIILDAPSLTNREVMRGVLLWINRYYPALKDLTVSLEDPTVVEEMIRQSMFDDEES